MPFIDTERIEKLHYIETGNGDKTILFIHGNLASAEWWKTTMNKLSEDYTAIAIDLPGSGKTPETGEKHTIEYFSELIESFVDKLKIKDFFLIGHSMGGGVSQLYTIKNQDKVKKLILIDTMACNGFHVLFEQGSERMKRIMKDKTLLRKAMANIAPMCRDKEVIDAITETAYKASEQVFLQQPVTMHEAYWCEDLDSIETPVLFLHGEHDYFTSKEDAFKTHQLIKNSEFKEIKNCGHSPMLEKFEKSFREIIDFIEK